MILKLLPALKDQAKEWKWLIRWEKQVYGENDNSSK